MAISEILRFPLPKSSSSSSAFRVLRDKVSSKGQVNTQYFGYVVPNEGFPVPKREDEMCWVIRTSVSESLTVGDADRGLGLRMAREF
jgi:hypothetical protein